MHGGTIPSELLAGTGLTVTGALHHWLLVPPVAAHPPLVHLARLTGVHGEVVPPAPQLTVDRAAHTPLPLLHPVLPHHPQPAPPVPRLHAHRDRGASRAGWAGRHAGVADPPPALPDLPARPRWAWGARSQAPQAHQVGPVSLSYGPVDDPVLTAFEEEVVVAGDGVALPVHQRTVQVMLLMSNMKAPLSTLRPSLTTLPQPLLTTQPPNTPQNPLTMPNKFLIISDLCP